MPNFRQVHLLLSKHDGLVSEVAANVKEAQTAMEEKIKQMTEQLSQASTGAGFQLHGNDLARFCTAIRESGNRRG